MHSYKVKCAYLYRNAGKVVSNNLGKVAPFQPYPFRDYEILQFAEMQERLCVCYTDYSQ